MTHDGSSQAGDARSSRTEIREDLESLPAGHAALGDDATTELLPQSGRGRTVLHALGLVEQAIGTFLLMVILVLVLVQVAQRYLPGGWAWTGELSRFSLVWCTFVLSGYLMAHDRHIAIQVVDLLLPTRALGVVKLIVHVVVTATCLAMAYASYDLIVTDIGQRTPAAEVPLAWIYVVPLLGFLLTALRAVLAIGLLDIPEITRRQERAA